MTMINTMTPKRAAVLALLQQAGKPMRPLDIAAATGMKHANVCMMLLRMRTDGQAERVDHGQWRTVAAGDHGAHA